MSSQIEPHLRYAEPRLQFHPERTQDVETHPLRGLLRFGPYSAGFVPSPIRIATIAPYGQQKKLYSFLKELNSEYEPTERKDYLPKWPGFGAAFNVKMGAAIKDCHLELGERLQYELDGSPSPHTVLLDHLIRAVHSLQRSRNEFDVLFIYIPISWQRAFKGLEGEDFDLRDSLKAVTAARGVPIQLIREDRALAYPDRASVMWRIGLALYAKAGGVPWKLADSDPEAAYLGVSYALRPVESGRPRFVTCCSQVFDAEGAGLEFVAYDAHEVEVQRDNPFLSRNEMFRVMTRSMDLYRRRHSGRTPRRITVHKTTEFKKDEVEGCMEALHLCEEVNLVQVVEDVSWRGARIDPGKPGAKGVAAMYPVERGSLVGLGPKEALLWMHGEVGNISLRNKPYFQGARSTPRPIRLIRHAGHGTWDETAMAALALSKMNWNNDALYDHLPVTMSYAHILANVVKRMPVLGSAPYQFRYFM